MSADRCPSCAAAVRPDASWCNQCFADLRPAPAPVAPPVPVTATAVVEDPFTAPLEDVAATVIAEVPAQASGGIPAEPLPGVVPTVDARPVTWPCMRCQSAVPFDEDECPNCHAKFLDHELPGAEVTLLDRLPRGQRKASTAFMVMVFGGLGLTVLFVVLFALFAAIF
jgi:RNA polymerase subunit RPABC4/transcription elongation factor Spt4